MTKEIALHCMKSYSELHSDLCELCPIYGQTGSDHCFEDALQYVIGMLEQEPTSEVDFKLKDYVSREAVRRIINSPRTQEQMLNALNSLRNATECKAEDCINRDYTAKYVEEFANNEYVSQDEAETIYLIADGIRHIPSILPKAEWIPVTEKLPHDRDWYLGIFKEPDTGWINPLPYICDYVGRETKATTKEYWILRGFTDWDDYHIDYYFNLECVAWMPLPLPWKGE